MGRHADGKFYGKTPWTDAIVDRLKALYSEGVSFAIISNELGREFGIPLSRNACIGKAARLNLEERATVIHRNRQVGVYSAKKRKPYVRKLVEKPKPRFHCDPIKLREVNTNALHLSVTDLERGQCRYPYGDGPFTFCAAPTCGGASYCEPHFALTHSANPSELKRIKYTKFGMIKTKLEAA